MTRDRFVLDQGQNEKGLRNAWKATYVMKTANIPAEIVRAKVLESFGRRIAAVRIMVMCVSIVAPAISWPSFDSSALSVVDKGGTAPVASLLCVERNRRRQSPHVFLRVFRV